MKKKSIIFLADSAVDLMDLHEQLCSKFNIIWVVYHKSVYEILKKKNIDNVYLSNLSIKILNVKNFVIKFISLFLNLFNIKFDNHSLHNFLREIELKYSPVLIVTDTRALLSNYNTNITKIILYHSVPYNKCFLHENNLKYDYVFFPGFYHLERFKKFYNYNDQKKLLVSGNIKISHFLKKNTFNKKKHLDYLGLNSNNINVVFAPSWKAHGKNIMGKSRFLPKCFGDEIAALKALANEIKILNCNFIIKLHHYSNLKKNILKKLEDQNSCYVFNSGQNHDTTESNEIFMLSDIIITDISGVATTSIFLNKKIIFLDPEKNFDWIAADIEKEYRPGFVCNNKKEILDSIKKYINGNDPFVEDKKKFVEKMFYKPYENANVKIADHINNIVISSKLKST